MWRWLTQLKCDTLEDELANLECLVGNHVPCKILRVYTLQHGSKTHIPWSHWWISITRSQHNNSGVDHANLGNDHPWQQIQPTTCLYDPNLWANMFKTRLVLVHEYITCWDFVFHVFFFQSLSHFLFWTCFCCLLRQPMISVLRLATEVFRLLHLQRWTFWSVPKSPVVIHWWAGCGWCLNIRWDMFFVS